jgi:predicted flap endonuclease-1-like 5' DNA nuclease
MTRKLSLALALYAASLFLSGFGPLADEDGTSPILLWGVCGLLVIVLVLALIYAINGQRKKTETVVRPGQVSDGAESLVAPGMGAQSPLSGGMAMQMQAKQELAVEDEIAAQGGVADNLEIIEGIGPTIAGVLQAAGIRTFAQLAKSDPAEIKEILNEAGMGNLADPTSWSEQAQLAADGKLDQLAALQANLKAGRSPE